MEYRRKLHPKQLGRNRAKEEVGHSGKLHRRTNQSCAVGKVQSGPDGLERGMPGKKPKHIVLLKNIGVCQQKTPQQLDTTLLHNNLD